MIGAFVQINLDSKMARSYPIGYIVSGAIELELPEAPSSNRYWRKWKNHIVKSSEAREYQQVIATALSGRRPLTDDVVLSIDWYRSKRMGDLSNRVKIVEDALKGYAFVDDKQVIELRARRFEDKMRPRMHVIVTPVAP